MRDSLYGRGTTDMKGFLACVLSTVARIDASRLVRPLHIALTHDEEVGCFGAKTLIRHLPPARAIIVGEPTAMRIADRHKALSRRRSGSRACRPIRACPRTASTPLSMPFRSPAASPTSPRI
ncbi:M20/M25/M40 family metallo-hydrolase [Tistrella bauzanensis]